MPVPVVCKVCGLMVYNLTAHMNVSHATTQPSASTAPIGAHWCPMCRKSVSAIVGAISKKMICTICGGAVAATTSQFSAYKDDPPTEPMLVAAKPVTVKDDAVDLVFCTKCGCTYMGQCSSGHDPSYLKRA